MTLRELFNTYSRKCVGKSQVTLPNFVLKYNQTPPLPPSCEAAKFWLSLELQNYIISRTHIYLTYFIILKNSSYASIYCCTAVLLYFSVANNHTDTPSGTSRTRLSTLSFCLGSPQASPHHLALLLRRRVCLATREQVGPGRSWFGCSMHWSIFRSCLSHQPHRTQKVQIVCGVVAAKLKVFPHPKPCFSLSRRKRSPGKSGLVTASLQQCRCDLGLLLIVIYLLADFVSPQVPSVAATSPLVHHRFPLLIFAVLSVLFFFFITFTLQPNSQEVLLSAIFWTWRGHSCRPFSPPGTGLYFPSRIGFSIPTPRRASSNVANSRSRAFR